MPNVIYEQKELYIKACIVAKLEVGFVYGLFLASILRSGITQLKNKTIR